MQSQHCFTSSSIFSLLAHLEKQLLKKLQNLNIFFIAQISKKKFFNVIFNHLYLSYGPIFLDIWNPWVILDQTIIFVFHFRYRKSATIRFLKKIQNFQNSDLTASQFVFHILTFLIEQLVLSSCGRSSCGSCGSCGRSYELILSLLRQKTPTAVAVAMSSVLDSY